MAHRQERLRSWALLLVAMAALLPIASPSLLVLSPLCLSILQPALRMAVAGVALAISLLTWNTRREQPLRLVLGGFAFFAVALLSAGQLLLPPGLPASAAAIMQRAADAAVLFAFWSAALGSSAAGSAAALRLGIAGSGAVIVASLLLAANPPTWLTPRSALGLELALAAIALAVIPLLVRQLPRARTGHLLLALAALLQALGMVMGIAWRGRDGIGAGAQLPVDALRLGAALLVYLALFREGVLAPWRRLVASGREIEADLGRYQQLFESAPDGLLVVDRGGRIQRANPAAAKLFGWPIDELIGLPVETLLPEPLRLQHREQRGRFQVKPQAREMGSGGALMAARRDGSTFSVEIALVPQSHPGADSTLCIVRDVTERRRLERSLMRQALQDALTELPNRRRFYADFAKALAVAERQGRALGLMFVDLDNFKQINDTLGHSHGDELLRQVARRLSGALRAGDLLARMGGDEFAIYLVDADADDAEAVAAKLLKVLEPEFELSGQWTRIGASIGLAAYPAHGRSVEELLSHADIAMYRAKQRGRNTWCCYEQRMSDGARERLNLQQDLVHAIERQQLELEFQPRVRADDGRLSGFEALLRWRHPQHGLVRPDVFIELAENCGLIVPIGEWVLRQSCHQAARWRADGAGALTMAVNVSTHQLRDAGFANCVREVLAETGWPAEQLELEITETALMADAREASALLHCLAALGVRIAVDDFGTGYSSLAYLKEFPLHRLKVDRSFVRGLQAEGSDRVIASSIIALAHALGLKVTAEGVETDAQRSFLLERDCDELQGYLYSPPIPAARCESWLATAA